MQTLFHENPYRQRIANGHSCMVRVHTKPEYQMMTPDMAGNNSGGGSYKDSRQCSKPKNLCSNCRNMVIHETEDCYCWSGIQCSCWSRQSWPQEGLKQALLDILSTYLQLVHMTDLWHKSVMYTYWHKLWWFVCDKMTQRDSHTYTQSSSHLTG